MEDITVNINGTEYTAKVEEIEDGKTIVHINGDSFEIDSGKEKEAVFDILKKKHGKEKGSGTIYSPLPGTVYEVKIKKGDKVKEGQSLLTLIAMKMENDIAATKAGTVKEVKVKKNDAVNKGEVLIVID